MGFGVVVAVEEEEEEEEGQDVVAIPFSSANPQKDRVQNTELDHGARRWFFRFSESCPSLFFTSFSLDVLLCYTIHIPSEEERKPYEALKSCPRTDNGSRIEPKLGSL